VIGLASAPRAMLLVSFLLAIPGWWLDTAYGVTTVLKYLPAFTLGAMTFTANWKPGRRSAYLSLAGFAAMTLATAATPFLLKTTPDPFDQDIWGLVWMLPLLPYVAHSLTTRSSKLDRHFGNLSFPLYLIHYAVIAMATQAWGYGLPVKLGAVVVSVVLALIAYWLIDRPIDRIRVRVTEGPRRVLKEQKAI
jgi:peptidoglycan/LPS O-acetylase OafA/YrhL